MKVVALQTWANGSLSMEEKQVADIPDDLAAYLIERGIVAESPEYYGGGSGGGVLVVTDTEGTLDKTWQEIHDAGFSVLVTEDMYTLLKKIGTNAHDGYYVKYWIYDETEYGEWIYSADSASGYPTQAK